MEEKTKGTMYINMRKFISEKVNWENEDFSIIAKFFGTHNGGFWEIDESYIFFIKE